MSSDTKSVGGKLGLRIHPTVFWATAGVTLFFVVFTLLNLSRMTLIFDATLGFITTSMGWFFVICVNIYLAVVLFLLFSRHAHIRLGGDDARPDFTYWGWLSMLFSAGMGIGLMFWSVAEPIYHFTSPPWGEAQTAEAARLAMGVTFFHWGFHAWGLYGLMALALAYFAYNKGLPLTVRSTFYPLLGERIHGRVGDLIDTLASRGHSLRAGNLARSGCPAGECRFCAPLRSPAVDACASHPDRHHHSHGDNLRRARR